MQTAKVTLAEAIQFLIEPLDCNVDSVARRLVATAVGTRDTPTAQVIQGAWRVSCDTRIRPAIPLIAVLLAAILFTITLRNAFVKLLRWYAAARGSAFVAVATAALRELHASSSGMVAAAAAAGVDPATAIQPRPPSLHRWYTPQAVTAPVVCCACFQPVVVAAGAEGHAQCCELCGVVAHGSCTKAVPHNCRLLVLPSPPPPPPPAEAGNDVPQPSGPPRPPPLAHDWRPAGTTLDLILPPADAEMLLMGASDAPGAGAGPGVAGPGAGPAAASSHGPPSLCLYCGAPCEVGLLAVEPVWRCGGCRRFTHVQCWALLHPGVLSAATRAALQGQALEAEEIAPPGTPGGSSPRWEHAQRRDGGPAAAQPHPGAAAGAGSGCPACEDRAQVAAGAAGAAAGRGSQGGGAPAGRTATATPRGSAGDSARGRQQPTRQPPAAAAGGVYAGPSTNGDGTAAASIAGTAASGGPKPGHSSGAGAGSGVGAGAGAGAGTATAAGTWDRHRRCSSLPNIAGQGGRASGGGGVAGGGGPPAGQQHSNHGSGPHPHQPHHQGVQRGLQLSTAQSLQPPAGAGADGNEAAGHWGDVGGGGGGGGFGGGGYAAAAAAAEGRLVAVDRLVLLDVCDPQESLGPLGAMVLPPSAVLPSTPASTLASTLAAGWAARPDHTAGTAAPPRPGPGPASGSEVTAAAAPAVATRAPVGGGGGGRGRKKQQQQRLGRALRQAHRWYRSHAAGWSLSGPADAAGPDRWRHFHIGALPRGCKPLVVFINPRSGPQVGELLRRQLLQLLHPLQVVDLVRESPSAALRCWWGVPGLRVLVVGGDGTVGWILGEMDARAVEAEAEVAAAAAARGGTASGGEDAEEVRGARSEGAGESAGTSPAAGGAAAAMRGPAAGQAPRPPPPPPVAVLPLGTGNDLARVLGWGGGLAALDARGGVAAVLSELAVAAPTPLDRWALAITPTPPEPPKRGRTFLPRRRQQSPPAPKPSPPAPSQIKVFNNYLGVGIDSWCALEFHRMRERYPGWFRSQLGNKMWYTGVGARDLLARSCVDLPSRLQLVCDGVAVELPATTQGILLLNIPSYMGGVDLWGNGVTHQQQQQQQLMLQHPQPHLKLQRPQLLQQPGLAATPAAGREAAAAVGNGSGGGGGGGGRAQDGSPERAATATANGGATGNQASAALGGSVTPYTSTTVRRGAVNGSSGSVSAGPSRATSDVVQSSPSHPHPPHSSTALYSAPAPAADGPAATMAAAPPPPHPSVPQSMSDGVLEVVAVYGAVHLGQLQVGLARATRLCQCRTAVITTYQALPMQIDGEPWMQPAAQLSITLKGSALLLRRLDLSSATSRLTAAVGEVLDGAAARGTITAAQRRALGADLARRLGAPHAV